MEEKEGLIEIIEKAVMSCVEMVKPDQQAIIQEVNEYKYANPDYNRDELADNWADRICWLYASAGAASALPGVIPGLGTAAQIGVEGASISADLLYMLRCMSGMVNGISYIYQRDCNMPFNEEFVRVLGLWCGVLTLTKEATVRISSKIAIAQFQRVPAEIFKQINKRVGTTIVTKYGTKRGGIAVGKLVPFGIGALVGGGFNLATMKGFKAAAINYYQPNNGILIIES